MAVLYEDFLNNVLPHVPGCPEFAAVNAVRNAVIEFCEKSFILTRDHDPITVVEKVVDYDLEPPTGYLVVKVMKAWLEHNPLDPLAPDFVRDAAVYNRLFSSYQAAGSTPRVFLQKEERSISLWPVPEKKYSNGLTLRVALKPLRTSISVEDLIYEDYAEAIAYGALSRLLMTPKQAFTDVEMAAVNKGLFTQAINTARQRATHGHARANLSVQLRRI